MARPTKNEALFRSIIDTLAEAVAERLGSRAPATAGARAAPKAAAGKKRNMSPEGRARIIAAAKKRWAKYRKAQATKA